MVVSLLWTYSPSIRGVDTVSQINSIRMSVRLPWDNCMSSLAEFVNDLLDSAEDWGMRQNLSR
jgi:hypothetical protein